jgi:RNA polymerase sigma-70 factor (ECF subfamily)
MPPLPLRYVGREAIIGFYAMLRAVGPRPMDRLVPTRANRQPALAAYRLDPADGRLHAWGVIVLTLDGEAIAELTGFNDPELVPWFGLPASLASGTATAQ